MFILFYRFFFQFTFFYVQFLFNCFFFFRNQNNLKQLVISNTNDDSQLFKLIVKRSYELLLKGVLYYSPSPSPSPSSPSSASSTYDTTLQLKNLLIQYGMPTQQQHLCITQILQKANNLLAHNRIVHQETYKTILTIIDYHLHSIS